MSMLDLASWGAALATTRPAEEIVRMARHSEKLGFDSFWLAEVYHWRSSIPIAAAIAASTQRVRIGLGIVPVHARHPALAAMEAVTLDEISHGRLIFGFGSARRVAEEHGKYIGPVKAMLRTLDRQKLWTFMEPLLKSPLHTLRPELLEFAQRNGVVL